MIRIGEYNNLEISKDREFGYFLSDESGNEVLLPKSLTNEKKFEVGDKIKVFVYKDSQDRPVATLKTPLAVIGDIAYLKVVSISKIGAFIGFGLDRDILVPIKEQRFKLKVGRSYLFYLYLDKTGRMAATTKVEDYLETTDKFKVGDVVKCYVYARSNSGTLSLAIDGRYKALMLKNEYFKEVFPGEEMELRVRTIYEDGTIGLATRKKIKGERDDLMEKILIYMKANGGYMTLNDKSSPEDIREVFDTSKNYFKASLGGLMKEGKIIQEKEGCKLK